MESITPLLLFLSVVSSFVPHSNQKDKSFFNALDLRLHPFFPTIEFRICDVPMRVDETICLAAVMQALVAKLYALNEKNLSYRKYPKYLINENK
ncbi:hypothetical protein SAMN05660206_11752 [Sphingobacterium wenxiniae]|uniref:Uncharacterized protein n=1 Tax=Sphingobacterium wenxiniae TaxID=683125 RepID=A0A1I6VU13_9SPHI|nr:hypothetical protein SAMN05660206_11752 [Sphingobacterium wenxiniae]